MCSDRFVRFEKLRSCVGQTPNAYRLETAVVCESDEQSDELVEFGSFGCGSYLAGFVLESLESKAIPTCDVLAVRHLSIDVQSDVLQYEAAVLVDDALSPPRELVDRDVLPPLVHVAVLIELSAPAQRICSPLEFCLR